jgi:hypothetical protein
MTMRRNLVGGIHCLLIDPVSSVDLIETSVVDDTRSPSRPGDLLGGLESLPVVPG